ncbi:MAG: hypothetical protein Q4B52_03675 [Tissierellia bacterium]|nr:hypothetical protein [Tissierellia bacterium]
MFNFFKSKKVITLDKHHDDISNALNELKMNLDSIDKVNSLIKENIELKEENKNLREEKQNFKSTLNFQRARIAESFAVNFLPLTIDSNFNYVLNHNNKGKESFEGYDISIEFKKIKSSDEDVVENSSKQFIEVKSTTNTLFYSMKYNNKEKYPSSDKLVMNKDLISDLLQQEYKLLSPSEKEILAKQPNRYYLLKIWDNSNTCYRFNLSREGFFVKRCYLNRSNKYISFYYSKNEEEILFASYYPGNYLVDFGTDNKEIIEFEYI